MRLEKIGYPLHRKEVEKISHCRNAHGATRHLVSCHQLLTSVNQSIHGSTASLVKSLARMGECELARGALQQPCTELSLKLLNPPA
ncbi:hypothetical protein D3C78_1643340 [compost metagenome]